MRVMFVYQGHENLGLEYLSAAVQQAGHETTLAFDPALFADGFIDHPGLAELLSWDDELVAQARRWRPDVLCVGVLTPYWRWALRLAEKLRAATGATVVFGGLHPSAAPEEVLERAPVADYVMVGECDRALPLLLEALAGRRELAEVPNLVWREGDETRRTPLGAFVPVDRLPRPDKELFRQQAPHTHYGYTVAASRGCPMRCTFCCESYLSELSSAGDKGFLRRRPVEDVISELEAARDRYGFDHVRFYDDILVWDRRWFREFAAAYRERVGVPYWCFVYPSLVDAELVQLLEDSGCFEVQMGVQTAWESTRRVVLNRRERDDQVATSVALFARSKIALSVDTILGLPGQSEEEILDMVAFYAEHRPDRINSYWLTYFPGTTIVPMAVERGDLSADEAAKLVDDPEMGAFHVNRPAGRDDLHRLHTYLVLSRYVPRRLHPLIRQHRLYRMLPAGDAMATVALGYLMSRRRFAHLEQRMLRRYLHFGARAITRRLRGLVASPPWRQARSGA